jgi:hypothetical protein
VGWSVGYKSPPESDLIDEILFAAGKALYVANSFESKCRFVLQAVNFVDLIKDDPVIALEEVAARLPGDKWLGPTLLDLFSHTAITITDEERTALTKAKDARNYLAHEAAGNVGNTDPYSVRAKIDALRRLHHAVTDLANGDNIVSAWVYQIEEPREPMPSIIDIYPDLVDGWVFGHLPREWLDPGWQPDHQRPKTVIAAVSYKPWYSRAKE